MKSVRKLLDIIEESRTIGIDVIKYGVHPTLEAKGAEGSDPQLRCRIAFIALRAWAATGLDVHSFYQENHLAPSRFKAREQSQLMEYWKLTANSPEIPKVHTCTVS